MKNSLKDVVIGTKLYKLTVLKIIPPNNGIRTQYHCSCECGNKTTLVKFGVTKSCGCSISQIYPAHNIKPFGIASRNNLIHSYKGNAKHKGLPFNLTNEYMIQLFESNCYYCGKPPYTVTKKGKSTPYTFTGIDRLDNSKELGYTVKNTKPCCSRCNYIKKELNHDEFISWIKESYNNLNDNFIL